MSRMTHKLSVLLQAIHLLHNAGIELHGIALSPAEIQRVEQDMEHLGIPLPPEGKTLNILGVIVAEMEFTDNA